MRRLFLSADSSSEGNDSANIASHPPPDTHLSCVHQLVLLLGRLERRLDGRQPLGRLVLGDRGRPIDHGHGLAQASGPHREVRADLLGLELLTSEVQGPVPVVDPDLRERGGRRDISRERAMWEPDCTERP